MWGDEFRPPRLAVPAFAPGDIDGKILRVDLPPDSVEGDLVQGHASDLEHQVGLREVMA
jgi:hypothetical protein